MLTFFSIIVISFPGKYWCIAGAILLFVAGQYIKFKRSYKDKKRDQLYQLRKFLREIQQIIYAAHRKEIPLRINIMRPDKKGVLRIFTHIGMEKAQDLGITFPPGKGCAGKAFELGRVIVGDLQHTSPKKWGLTNDQIKITKGLKSILSIPLKFKDKVIGVLNVDSPLSVETIGFTDLGMIKKIEIKSNDIADFLGFYFT